MEKIIPDALGDTFVESGDDAENLTSTIPGSKFVTPRSSDGGVGRTMNRELRGA